MTNRLMLAEPENNAMHLILSKNETPTQARLTRISLALYKSLAITRFRRSGWPTRSASTLGTHATGWNAPVPLTMIVEAR